MTSPHFAWLPPEINSALMFAGPGPGPLIAAATAWEGLAQDLASSAASFGSVTSELASGSWLGPSSATMMAVAAQYMAWLSAAAGQAEQAAGQALATVSAFETALAATIQPAVVAANRGLIQILAATNFLGNNAPAIMDTEAAYEQMWALDVAAMAGYHFDVSAVAAQLAPWQKVLQTVGIDIGPNGEINLGWGNTGSGNIGTGNHGSGNIGSGNTGNNNFGTGNTGTNNFGTGNTGDNNVGLGNWGIGNIGFANTGVENIGFGLTGDHQIGFGGFNSGNGNVGFGNSGTGNSGLFNSGTGNMGIGNSGTQNTGLGNSGTVNTGFGNSSLNSTGWANGAAEANPAATSQVSIDPSLTSVGHYAATGAISTGPLSTSILNSIIGHTGGVNPAIPSSGAFPYAPTSAQVTTAAVSLDTGNAHAALSSAATNGIQHTNFGPRSVNPGYPGFYSSGTPDAGLRNMATVRESEITSPGTGGNAAGIPRSNFYQTGDRAPSEPKSGPQQQAGEE